MKDLSQVNFTEVELEATYIVMFGYDAQLGETGLTQCTGRQILERVAGEEEIDPCKDDNVLKEWEEEIKDTLNTLAIDYCIIYKLF